MGKLLQEAMLDAKAIRETALANARAALEEAFTPRLQKMISQKIQSEVDGEEEETITDEVPTEEPVEEPVEASTEEPTEEPVEDPAADVAYDEPEIETSPIDSENPEDETEELGLEENGSGTKVTSDAGADPEKASGGKNSNCKSKMIVGALDETDEIEGAESDDFDLESIIRELEDEANSPEEFSDEDVDEVVQFGGKATKDAGNDPEGEKKTNKVYPDGKTSKLTETENVSSDETVPYDAEANDEEEIDLDEILRELESEESHEVEKHATDEPLRISELESENEKLKDTLAEVTSALEEHTKVVNFYKSKLNEVNLLNSKLLYTNKLFKGNSLNDTQKMTVIENFDRAKTMREVKLVYATIAESLKQTELFKKSSSNKKVKTLTEGLASKATASTKPAVVKAIKQQSIIDDGSAERLKKLAGIIK